MCSFKKCQLLKHKCPCSNYVGSFTVLPYLSVLNSKVSLIVGPSILTRKMIIVSGHTHFNFRIGLIKKKEKIIHILIYENGMKFLTMVEHSKMKY